MTIDVGDVQEAPDVEDGWQMNEGNTAWEKTFLPTAGDTTETSIGGEQFLTVNQVVDSDGCDKKSVDGVEVCVSKGHQLTFTCNYPLANQNISTDTDFTVSGSDTTDSAINTGSLNYALTVDNSAGYAIGNLVSATITPLSTGLVTATILNCQVKNMDASITNNQVSLINANLSPVCDLEVAITTGQGDSALAFTWNAFKWSTTQGASSEETQIVDCSIALAVNPATVNPNSCSTGQDVGWAFSENTDCEQPGSSKLSWNHAVYGWELDYLYVGMESNTETVEVTNARTLEHCKAECQRQPGCTRVIITGQVRQVTCTLWSSCSEISTTSRFSYSME